MFGWMICTTLDEALQFNYTWVGGCAEGRKFMRSLLGSCPAIFLKEENRVKNMCMYDLGFYQI